MIPVPHHVDGCPRADSHSVAVREPLAVLLTSTGWCLLRTSAISCPLGRCWGCSCNPSSGFGVWVMLAVEGESLSVPSSSGCLVEFSATPCPGLSSVGELWFCITSYCGRSAQPLVAPGSVSLGHSFLLSSR